jgi:hypothetical protein
MPRLLRTRSLSGSGGRLVGAILAVTLLVLVTPGVPAAAPPRLGVVPPMHASPPPPPSSPRPASAIGDWANLSTGLPTSPGPRYSTAAAWDGASNEALLFGGLSPIVGQLRVTWTFANGGWHVAGPGDPNATNVPTSRFGAAMAYDPAISSDVLFGGRDSVGGLLSDTWTFSAGTWVNVTDRISGAPPARVNASLAYDPALGALVLFGGRSPTALYADTWEFNGSAWSPVGAIPSNATNTPSARYGGALVFSPTLNELVLFGGTAHQGGNYVELGDTWTFGAGGWQQLHPTQSPSPRTFAAAAPLPDGEELLFGGLGATAPLSDTWTFDGANWTNETTLLGTAPSARYGAFAAPVSLGNGTGYILVFGGTTATAALDDTWAVGANTIVATRGAAAPVALDVNESTRLTVVAFGPIAGLSYVWSGLPTGCSSADTSNLSCTPSGQGRYNPSVQVSDGGIDPNVSVSMSLIVNDPPTITGVIVAPYPLVLGAGNVTITVQASGGTGTLRYSYLGLPPGCRSNDTSFLLCAPTTTGSWSVGVTVEDAANGTGFRTASVAVTATGPSKPNHLLSLLVSPLGLTALVIGAGILLMLLYVVTRSRRSRPPASGSPVQASAPPATTRQPRGASSDSAEAPIAARAGGRDSPDRTAPRPESPATGSV